MSTEIAVIETAIVAPAKDLASQALAMRVANNQDRVSAAEAGRAIAAMVKRVHDSFDPIVDANFKAHKVAVAQRAAVLDPLESAKWHLAYAIGGYDQEMERQRLAEEQRLQNEQREREAQENARLRREAEDRQLAEAEAALEIGDADLAEAIVSAPTLVELPPSMPVIVPSAVQPVSGASTRTVWKFKIVDAAKIPREYLAVDEVKIGGVVRAMKGATAIPGVQAYPEAVTAFRS